MKQVAFYTRAGCCLCTDAMAIVDEVRTEVPFSLRIIDIDGDSALTEKYGEKIPVIEVDGRLHAKFRVDKLALIRCLAAGEHA